MNECNFNLLENLNQIALEHSRMKNITPHKRNFLKDCYLFLAKSKQRLGDWKGSLSDLRDLCKIDEDDSNSVIELGIYFRSRRLSILVKIHLL